MTKSRQLWTAGLPAIQKRLGQVRVAKTAPDHRTAPSGKPRKPSGGKLSKYRAVKTAVNGISFASKREAARYAELKLLQRSKKIWELRLQPRIKLMAGGAHICDYVADFVYFDRQTGKHVWEDVKGFKTPIYKLKKKLVLALTGIQITEV